IDAHQYDQIPCQSLPKLAQPPPILPSGLYVMYGTGANDDDDPAVGSVQYSMNVLACPGHDALCAERQRKLPQNLRWGRQFLNATDAQIVRVFVNNRPLRHHPKMIPETSPRLEPVNNPRASPP